MHLPSKSLVFLILIIQLAYGHAQADPDGRWQLSINGVDKLEFGSQFLAGGMIVGWESILEFSIKDGRFEQGTATAHLTPDIQALSRPAQIFDCKQVTGTFASRTGSSFSTPHLRYQAFPLTGQVIGEKVELAPFLEYPGNYFAIMYQCQTEDSRGETWIERAPRVARELGRRQNAETSVKDGFYRAKVKEVKVIAPRSKA